MKEVGRFDPDNGGMFVEPSRDFKSPGHLIDLRTRAERGEFGPRPLSRPRGDLVFRYLDNKQIAAYVEAERKAKKLAFGLVKGKALVEHIARTGDY